MPDWQMASHVVVHRLACLHHPPRSRPAEQVAGLWEMRGKRRSLEAYARGAAGVQVSPLVLHEVRAMRRPEAAHLLAWTYLCQPLSWSVTLKLS